MTSRRATLALVTLALFTRPIAGRAQRAERLRRIGFLSGAQANSPAGKRQGQQLRDALRGQGWEEGRNLVIEVRYAESKAERLPALARELLDLKVELIVAALNPSIAAAKSVTTTVPIVMHVGSSPVEAGYVKTLARPGGNITGTVWSGSESAGRILRIVKEAKPTAVRIATLLNPTFPVEAQVWRDESDRAAKQLGLSVQYFDVTRVEELTPALARIAAARPDALVAWGDSINIAHAADIAAFAIERRLLFASNSPRHVEAGGLLSFGPDLAALYDRTASFIDRILRGAAPVELPVEQPTKFDLIVNARTAAAIGHKIPAAVLVQATRVIE
jgi:putative ABC transport system substrate-binding protein